MSSGVSIAFVLVAGSEIEGGSVVGIVFEVFVLRCEEEDEERRGNAPNEED
jgi:hypothetical protein